MKIGKKLFVGALGASVVASVCLVGIPASAAPVEVDILDAASVVGLVDPGLDTSVPDATSSLDWSVGAGSSPRSRTTTVSAPTISTDPSSDDASGINFSIDYAQGAPMESGSFEVLAGRNEGTAAYVQELPTGVRTITAISSADAPTSYDYTFDVPDGTEFIDLENGYRIQPPADASLGVIQNPWAKDANGKDLPTSYTWSGKTLTQHVDFSAADVTFPVLIDPAWTYTISYENDPVSPQKAYDKLKTCFNCFFPVEGAPQKWPAYMQHLPLKVRPFPGGPAWNFACTFFGSTKFANGDFSFIFLAAPGHVDGEGSTIEFTFLRTPGDGKSRLYVDAYIMNTNPGGIPQPAYYAGAAFNWAKFSENIRMITIIT